MDARREDAGLRRVGAGRIAFGSDRDGRRAVYVADFPSMARIALVAAGGAPVWSRDGRWLFYRRGSGEEAVVMAVDVGPSPRFAVSAPQPIANVPRAQSFDLLPDGSVAVVEGNQTVGATRQLNVVLNWFTELRKKVPGR